MALCKISESTGSKFIVIIDEWDALFREAKEEAGYKKIICSCFVAHKSFVCVKDNLALNYNMEKQQ